MFFFTVLIYSLTSHLCPDLRIPDTKDRIEVEKSQREQPSPCTTLRHLFVNSFLVAAAPPASALTAGGLTMSSLKLHLRDMRQLFSSQSKSEPAISVRRNCILINFETIRGIVLVDR